MASAQVDAVRQSVALVIGEVYSALAVVEEALEGSAGDVDIRQVEKIKAVAQFLSLSRIGGDATSFHAELAEVKARLKESESAEYFRKMIQFSIVEIKCKLGNIQCELEESASVERAVFLARAVDAIKEHLADADADARAAPLPASLAELDAFAPPAAATRLPVAPPSPRALDDAPPRPLAGADLRDAVERLCDELARLGHALPALDSGALVRAAYGVSELRRIWDATPAPAGRARPAPPAAPLPLEKQVQMRRVLADSAARLRAALQKALAAPPAATPPMLQRARLMLDQLQREALVAPGAAGGGAAADGARVSQELLGFVHLQLLLQSEERAARRVQADSRLLDTLQHQLFTLNRQRHLLALSLRNLDTKISHMIRARAGAPDDDAPAEPYVQLEQEASATLGERKELYERLTSVLRSQPAYLAAMCALVATPADAELFASAVAGSLYADSFLASEELLLLAALKECLTADLRAVEPELFLRSNSVSTKLIAVYCRRHAPRQYLVATLTDACVAIMILSKESDLNLEIDPLKRAVSSGLLAEDARWDPAVLRAHPELEAKVEAAQKRLFVFAKKFIEAILGSLPAVPIGLRFLSRLLIDLARSHSGGTLTRQKQLTLLGGFFFLRFLVPAVIAPEQHGIRLANSSAPLDPVTRRNLLLIAKVLQNLANGAAFGDKEPFMQPLNAFLDEHRPPLEAFLEAVAAPFDLPPLPGPRRAHALERTITLAPAELALLHRLVHDHHAQLSTGSPRDQLAAIATRLGAPPKEPPKRRNFILNVSLPSLPSAVASPRSPARETLKAKLERLLVALEPLDSDALAAPAVSLPDVLQVLGSLTARPEHAALAALYEEVRQALDYLLADAPSRAAAAELTATVLREMAAECKERRARAEQADEERVELQAAVEAQEREVTALEGQKRTLLTYLASVTQSNFVARTRSRGTKSHSAAMIGPLVLPVKELERLGVLVATEALAALKAANVTVKLSCTNPGFVALETRTRSGAVRFFELQPARLLDELLTRDAVRFGDLVFDVRKLLAFLYRHFGC